MKCKQRRLGDSTYEYNSNWLAYFLLSIVIFAPNILLQCSKIITLTTEIAFGLFFALFVGTEIIKSKSKDNWSQFHQHFTRDFFANILVPKNFKAVCYV